MSARWNLSLMYSNAALPCDGQWSGAFVRVHLWRCDGDISIEGAEWCNVINRFLIQQVAQNPHEVLLAMAIAYALSGPIIWAYRKQFTKPAEAKVATSKKTASALKARVAKPKPEPPKSEKAKPGKAKVQKDLNSKDDS